MGGERGLTPVVPRLPNSPRSVTQRLLHRWSSFHRQLPCATYNELPVGSDELVRNILLRGNKNV